MSFTSFLLVHLKIAQLAFNLSFDSHFLCVEWLKSIYSSDDLSWIRNENVDYNFFFFTSLVLFAIWLAVVALYQVQKRNAIWNTDWLNERQSIFRLFVRFCEYEVYVIPDIIWYMCKAKKGSSATKRAISSAWRRAGGWWWRQRWRYAGQM